MLVYKIDVLEKLKERGYTSYKIRQEKLLAQSTLTRFRRGIVVSAENIDILCKLLECQPGDIIEYRKG